MVPCMSGECNCGNVTYEVFRAPLLTYVCHCGNCQKRSGSAFGMWTYPTLVESVLLRFFRLSFEA